jgi:hypothetical protein
MGKITRKIPSYGYNTDMARSSRAYEALPATAKDQLVKLGKDIAVARKRRRMSMVEMGERMMVNLKTVQRLEKGDPAVGMGIVASALWVLGMHRRIGDLVAPESDTTALQEDIQSLPRDFRRTKKQADKFDF